MKTINLLFIYLLVCSCGQTDTSKIAENPTKKTEIAEQVKPEEVVEKNPEFSPFWRQLFQVDNELKFKEKTENTRFCDENGEMILSEDGEIEPDYIIDESSKNVSVKIVKVEKDQKGIWIATIKSNDPSFPSKWYTDEKSVWFDDMAMHFPSNPKKLSKNIKGTEVEIDYDKSSHTWTYSEFTGEIVYTLSFQDKNGLSSISHSYDGACESNQVMLTKKQ
jgi:hypothetical protein